MSPEGNNAIAATEPISARRRVSDLAELVYNGRILPEWQRAEVCRNCVVDVSTSVAAREHPHRLGWQQSQA